MPRVTATFVLLGMAWGSLPSPLADAGETMPAEAAVLQDARDGQLDEHSLLEAVLILEGASPIRRHESLRLMEEAARLQTRELDPAVGRDAEALPADVFRWTQRQLLTGAYDRTCFRVSETLSSGKYNCLSGVVLYLTLLRSAGGEAQAVSAPGHVYVRLLKPAVGDVEATCSDWFDREIRPVPPAGRLLDDTELLGKVLYNRGVVALGQGEYADALRWTRQARDLDPDHADSRANELAVLNNWALSLSRQGAYSRAAARLAELAAIEPNYPPLVQNDLHIHQSWAEELCRQARYGEAVDVLGKCRRGGSGREIGDSQFVVFQDWIEHGLRRGQPQILTSALVQFARTFPADEALSAEQRMRRWLEQSRRARSDFPKNRAAEPLERWLEEFDAAREPSRLRLRSAG